MNDDKLEDLETQDQIQGGGRNMGGVGSAISDVVEEASEALRVRASEAAVEAAVEADGVR